MSRHYLFTLTALALAGASAHAATVSGFHSYGNEPSPGGIEYGFLVTMGANDSATFQRHVGAWSWQDSTLFLPGEDPVGWTHTSDWVALTLTEATTIIIDLAAQEGVPWPSGTTPGRTASTASIFPSFSIWSGIDNDPVPDDFKTRPDVVAAFEMMGGVPDDLGDWHTYDNNGLLTWAEDLTSLVGFVDNSTARSAQATFTLPAGQYSIVLGSNAPASDPSRQGYRATLTTVPEPSAAVLSLLGLGGLLHRRRRAV